MKGQEARRRVQLIKQKKASRWMPMYSPKIAMQKAGLA